MGTWLMYTASQPASSQPEDKTKKNDEAGRGPAKKQASTHTSTAAAGQQPTPPRRACAPDHSSVCVCLARSPVWSGLVSPEGSSPGRAKTSCPPPCAVPEARLPALKSPVPAVPIAIAAAANYTCLAGPDRGRIFAAPVWDRSSVCLCLCLTTSSLDCAGRVLSFRRPACLPAY